MILYYFVDWIYSHLARDPYARMTITIPEALRHQIQIEAIKQGMTPIQFLQNCIKLGFMVCEVERNRETQLIIREGDSEQELLFK